MVSNLNFYIYIPYINDSYTLLLFLSIEYVTVILKLL